MKPSPTGWPAEGGMASSKRNGGGKTSSRLADGRRRPTAAGASLQHEIVVVEDQRLAIAASCQPGQRLPDALVAPGQRMIEFDDDDGVALGQRALGASQDLEVEAVDVDLQAVDAFDPMPVDEIVERGEGPGLDLAVRSPQAEDPVLALARRRRQGDLVDLGIAPPCCAADLPAASPPWRSVRRRTRDPVGASCENRIE